MYSTVVSRAGVVQLGFEKLGAERGKMGLTWEGFSEEVSEGKPAKMSEERSGGLCFWMSAKAVWGGKMPV